MKNLLKVFLMCFITLFAFAGQMMGQQKTITGRVVDALNEGMPGVNVQVKGTTSGTITNIDGDFSISVPNTKSVLVFTFIGYVKQEVAVGNQTKLNIQMKDDTQSLDEVVVVAYGTARKGDLTGALTTMRPDANEAAKAVSIDNLLEGKVAGLVVSTASSNPGAASSITIRGASSLRGDNQPLYVIDNIPQASTGEFSSSGISGDFQIAQDPLSSLNPADIEDITILKDASSTAIYGSRGANGVILITTKKGKEGKAKVNASATFTIANASRLLEMMNLEEYAAYHNSRITDGKVPFHIVGDEVRYVFNGAYDKYDPADPETYNVVNYRNWQKEIYTSAFSQNYSLSVNGGAGKTTYYISANFKDINGTVKQTGLKQGDLRANLSAQLSKSVDLNMALSGSLRQNNMMAGGNTLGGATGAISRTALDYAPFELPENDPSFTNENKTNVFSWLNDYVDLTDDKTFKASLNLNWKINKFFTYSLRAGGNINTNDRKRWYGMQLYQGMNNQGYLATSNLSKSNYSVENIVNYNTKLGSVGTLAATVGMTYDDYNFLNKNVIGKNFTMFEFRENGMHMAGEISYADGTGNKTTAMVVTNLSNSSLKWEKTSSWNVGLDFGLFNSRLSGTLDIYQKKTTDLLISRNLPGSAGFSSTYYNQGSLNNKGVEFSLNAQIIDSSSWKWSVSGNIGVNRNEISDLGLLPADFGCLGERVGYYGNSLGDHFGVGHIFLAGEAPGLFYGYVTQGIVQKEDITENGIKYIKQDGSVGYYQTVNKTTPVAGDVKYVDRNGDGVVDDNDRDIIGNPNPDFTYGFQTKVSWKSLSLSASFNGVQGRDILNVGNRYNNTPGTKSNNVTRKAFQNMWTDENPSNLYPKSTFVVQNMVMDRYVEDGSYLRCSDITLSYILPAKWTNKIGIKNTSVYASVKNAFVITDYSGYDPEVNSFAFDGLRPGVDMNSYPTPRSFVFGLNLTF